MGSSFVRFSVMSRDVLKKTASVEKVKENYFSVGMIAVFSWCIGNSLPWTVKAAVFFYCFFLNCLKKYTGNWARKSHFPSPLYSYQNKAFHFYNPFEPVVVDDDDNNDDDVIDDGDDILITYPGIKERSISSLWTVTH